MAKRKSNLKKLCTIGAVFGFLGVAIGAFGAHALKDILGERIGTFETANRYHFYHTFAIFLSAFLYSIHNYNGFLVSAYLFSLGILFFSGSLYALSISGFKVFGVITPIGGIVFLAGWLVLGYSSFYAKE